jgi:hypothetical protein
VRSINLLKLAAEAELLRLRTMMARQVRRGIFGVIAAVFAVAVLALGEVAGWPALRLKFQPISTTLILLGIDLAIAAVFGVLAVRSAPGPTEREALQVRQRALETARGSLVFTAALPTLRLLTGRRTSRRAAWRRLLGR